MRFSKFTSLFGLTALTAAAFKPDVQSRLTEGTKGRRQPNIVFFLTDDQDVQLESLSYQPLVKKHLIDKGLTYRHHFCTVALCCPSRVNLWTGKAAHNTNVTDVNPPYGKRTW
jgi:arylsulfatase A-like enzyme